MWCTLPPTCHTHPTSVGSSAELEAHYARYHAHVCHEEGCMCVFPDARLLELVGFVVLSILYFMCVADY